MAADEKLSQLTPLEPTVRDPFNDRQYYVAAEGATDIDKERAATPYDLMIGAWRRMAWFFTDFTGQEMPAFGDVGNSNYSDEQHTGVGQARVQNVDDQAGYWGAYHGLKPGQGRIKFVACVMFRDDVSDATDRFQALVGLPREGDAQLDQDGTYLRYSDDVNSGKWQLVTSHDGTATYTDTGVTVVANTWYRIEMDIAADLSSVSVSINGSAPATATTNITGRESTLGVSMRKLTGSNQRRLFVDFIGFMKHLESPR